MTANKLFPRWLAANGQQFACLELGSGPLVLCLHGFPDTAWSFAPLLRALADAGYRAVAPFMRGYAPSGIPADGDYRTTTLARDAIALIDALGAERAFIVGHDWGAATAYVAATLRPEKVRGIVTAAVPHLRRFLLRPTPMQLYRSRYMGFFQMRGVSERRVAADDFRWLRTLIRRWSPDWKFTEDDFAPLKAGFSDPQRLTAALSYYRALPATLASRDGLRLLSRKLPVPARVVRGIDDGCIGAGMFERQASCFAAGYELISMKGAGHFMHCEKPEIFAALVLEFIERNS
ncbi:MAG: alpha/beta fold hydrolase [Stenotrophobium sp.]